MIIVNLGVMNAVTSGYCCRVDDRFSMNETIILARNASVLVDRNGETDTLQAMNARADAILLSARNDLSFSHPDLVRGGGNASYNVYSTTYGTPWNPGEIAVRLQKSYGEMQPFLVDYSLISQLGPYVKIDYRTLTSTSSYVSWEFANYDYRWYLYRYNQWVAGGSVGQPPTSYPDPGAAPSPSSILSSKMSHVFNLDLNNPGGPSYFGPKIYIAPPTTIGIEVAYTNDQITTYRSSTLGSVPSAGYITFPLKLPPA